MNDNNTLHFRLRSFRTSYRSDLKMAIAFALVTTASIAHGQIYKCTDGSGTTAYSNVPCDSRSKPLKLPNDSKRNATDPNMCAQLLDETQRLAADADRDAQRGRAERSDNAKHRQALTKQYEARCVGISRSETKPK